MPKKDYYWEYSCKNKKRHYEKKKKRIHGPLTNPTAIFLDQYNFNSSLPITVDEMQLTADICSSMDDTDAHRKLFIKAGKFLIHRKDKTLWYIQNNKIVSLFPD